MEHLQAYNRKLLANILPVHVADYFLSRDKNMDVSILYTHQLTNQPYSDDKPNFFLFCYSSNLSFMFHLIRKFITNSVTVLVFCLHPYLIFPSFMLNWKQTTKVSSVSGY